MNRKILREALARGYGSTENQDKILDADLIEAMIVEVLAIDNEPQLGCATTEQLLDEIKTRIEMDGQLQYRTVDIDD